MTEPKLMTDDELSAIELRRRVVAQTPCTCDESNRCRPCRIAGDNYEDDVSALLSHIAAQSDEIKRLRAVIDEQHHVRVDETELHDLYETRQQALRDQLGPLKGLANNG